MKTRAQKRTEALERNEKFYLDGKSKNPKHALRHINELRRKLDMPPLPEAK